jgi:hypothetical protein
MKNFDVKHANPKKTQIFHHARAPSRGRKKAHRHIRGVPKIFIQTTS